MPRWLCWFLFAAVASAQAQKGAIEGQVTSVTGEPLKKVQVRIQLIPGAGGRGGAVVAAARVLAPGGSPPGMSGTVTDDAGRFVFENVEPGNYSLFAERPGYLRSNISGPSGSVKVAAGERATGISIKMTPQGLIAGKITDEDGDPVPGVRVSVGRWSYASGHKQFQPAGGGANSADDGSFVIGNLNAGRYYVSANPPNLGGRVEVVPQTPQEEYVPTYYPGVSDGTAATAIDVGAGREVRGIDLRMRKGRTYRVSGTVVDSTTGAAPGNMNVSLIPKEQDLFGGRPFSQARNGSFEFQHVLPGVYVLQVNPTTVRAADGSMVTNGLVGRQTVTVGNGNVEGIVLRLGPGVELTGKLTTEGTIQQIPAQVRWRVLLQPVEGATPGAGNPTVNDDGAFTMKGVTPATYRLTIIPMPPGSYLKSIRMGGQDVAGGLLDLTSVTNGHLEVVLSGNAADVRGTLRGDNGPLSNVQVSLWSSGSDSVKTAYSQSDGTFVFNSLAPGEYRVAAWEQMDSGMASVPEFREAFSSKAAVIRLSENSHETVEAPLIGREAIETEAAKLR